MKNVPDDWDQYWIKCPYCDRWYHASEYCVCQSDWEEKMELEEQDNG